MQSFAQEPRWRHFRLRIIWGGRTELVLSILFPSCWGLWPVSTLISVLSVLDMLYGFESERHSKHQQDTGAQTEVMPLWIVHFLEIREAGVDFASRSGRRTFSKEDPTGSCSYCKGAKIRCLPPKEPKIQTRLENCGRGFLVRLASDFV